MSPAFSFNRENAARVLRTFGWTLATAVIILLIDLVGIVEFPVQYAFLAPVINTVLYALKEFVAERR